jgi:hypothetical protein
MNVIEDLKRQARDADRVDRERADVLSGLVRHPGWEVYVRLVNAQVQARSDAVLEPANSVDKCVGLEYIKGAMSGLLLAVALPGAIIEQAKTLRKSEEEGEEE